MKACVLSRAPKLRHFLSVHGFRTEDVTLHHLHRAETRDLVCEIMLSTSGLSFMKSNKWFFAFFVLHPSDFISFVALPMHVLAMSACK